MVKPNRIPFFSESKSKFFRGSIAKVRACAFRNGLEKYRLTVLEPADTAAGSRTAFFVPLFFDFFTSLYKS